MRRPMVLAIVGALVVAVAAAVVVVRGGDDDPYDCGAIELAVPEVLEPSSTPPTVRLEAVLEAESVVAAAERSDGRLLVLARDGRLLQLPAGGGAAEVLWQEDVPVVNETGALGLAISPDERFVYLTYTPTETQSDLIELPLTPDGVDLARQRLVTSEPTPEGRHPMANLVFGPDGYLYVGAGDRANPPERAGLPSPVAQDLENRSGKIWRIDPRASDTEPYTIPSDNPFVDQEGAAAEVFLYGFRNPWRFSFDRETGDLWIADAGEYCAEEVDHLRSGELAGANLGWSVYEGPRRFDPDSDIDGVVAPVYWYRRSTGSEEPGEVVRCVIIGGFVYRGAAIPELDGQYLFADFCSGFVEVLDLTDAGVSVQKLVDVPDGAVQSFAQGRDGELYVLGTAGVFRLVPD